jgi:NAD(P)-dependent dehydrogenase (short-subunit alcohol dehydrogenase family)
MTRTGDRLVGKVAIVTGSGQGVGRGIALAMAHEGATIVVADVSLESGADVARAVEECGSPSQFARCDVTRAEDAASLVDGTIDRFGRIDVLVNNAVLRFRGVALVDTTEDDMLTMWACGPGATLRLMQLCFPIMRDAGGGSVVNIASRAGIDGNAMMGPYAAAKEGVRALTRVAAREWGPHHVRVNSLVPYANSPAYVEFSALRPDYVHERNALLPLQRVGDCEHDIGPAAVFLASDDSAYITGHTLMVDGGSCTF